ncbi:MAG: HlyD family type I secretion periplasmic adaptor subunit [Rhodocyclaceae bacterium]|nr:HlyD family type I secretion periplasmic adaptor subunit [Rhodocyclaceae bacterium]
MSFNDWLRKARERVEHRIDATFPADTAAALSAPDGDEPARWGFRALWIGAAALLVWAAVAPLGQGVPAHGFVKVEGSRKTIQHPRGGIVEDILVREGDSVQANQPLVRLNETQAQALLGSVDSQLVSQLAVEARMNAERNENATVIFPAFLMERKDLPQAQEAMQVQNQLFQARRAALRGEIAIAEENIAGLEEQIRGLQAQEQSKAEQLKLFQEELASLKPMYEQGFVPRNHMFELERSVAYLTGQRSEDLANIGRARSQIGEMRLKVIQARAVYHKEVETQLTEVQRQVADLKEKRIATQDDLDRIVLRAPVAGTIVDLGVHTVGGVVAAGQKLMDVVPAGDDLTVEVQIPPHLIDSIRVGQPADIHFLALDQTIVPTVPGKLDYFSADRLNDPKTDQPYFIGRVSVTAAGVAALGKHRLQPGMPADVVIKTNERTLLGYLLKPFLTRMQFAFTER